MSNEDRRQHKALAELEEGEPANDFEQALTLIAELKVVLIADDGEGGLNAESRALIRDLGKLLLKLKKDTPR